jgi:hypothetical protein
VAVQIVFWLDTACFIRTNEINYVDELLVLMHMDPLSYWYGTLATNNGNATLRANIIGHRKIELNQQYLVLRSRKAACSSAEATTVEPNARLRDPSTKRKVDVVDLTYSSLILHPFPTSSDPILPPLASLKPYPNPQSPPRQSKNALLVRHIHPLLHRKRPAG